LTAQNPAEYLSIFYITFKTLMPCFIENDVDNFIFDIVPKGSGQEWMSCIHEVLLGVDDGYIVNTAEIFFPSKVEFYQQVGI